MAALRHGLRFLLLGGLLFAGQQAWMTRPAAAPAREIVFDAAQLAALQAATARRLGRVPTAAEVDALVQQLADQEMLVMEALAEGRDRDDLLVRRRLLQNMRFVAQGEEAGAGEEELLQRAYRLDMPRRDPVVRQRLIQQMQADLVARAAREPTGAEIDALLQRRGAALASAERLEFRHIFASGEGAEVRLQALARQPPSPGEALRFSEPFLLAAQIGPANEAQLARDFGPRFAAAVMQLPAGQWSAPIRSPYGAHLVWVERRWPAVAADAAYARERARRAWRAAQQQQALAEATRALRSRYRLRHAEGAAS